MHRVSQRIVTLLYLIRVNLRIFSLFARHRQTGALIGFYKGLQGFHFPQISKALVLNPFRNLRKSAALFPVCKTQSGRCAICGKNLSRFSLVFLLIYLPFFTHAQDPIQSLIDQSNAIYFSDPDSSYALSCKAEAEAKKSGVAQYTGDIALGKARYLLLVTDYQACGKELNTAISFFESQKNYVNLSRAYALQSILLERIGEPEESTKTLLKAYQISKEHGDRPGEISRLTNLTLDFITQEKPDSAYKYLVILQALESDIKEEDRYFLEQNLGLYYHLIGENTKAIYYYERASQVADTYDMVDSKATILASLAEAYRELNMLAESERAALQSYELSVEYKLVFEERDAVQELVETYEALQNYKAAFEFRGKLIDIDERINKLEKIQKLKEDEYKLSLSQKEVELAQKELDIQNEQLKSARARSQNLVLYFVVLVVVLVLTFTIFIYLRTRKLNRTIEISRIVLEQKNREVMDSITYAKQIQDAMLPPRKYYQDLLREIFVFYRPKDIVAGDFYWLHKAGDKVFFAVADCTGHGVPGAMVSVICHGALNRCVKEFELYAPAAILEKTSGLVMETFVKSDREIKDGMDIALCVIDLKTNMLTFAGANNPAWIIKSTGSRFLEDIPVKNKIISDTHVLVELRGDKQPIGNFEKRQSFTDKQIQLEAGDTIYLSTDGYIDQFGGDKGKKFKSKFFKEKILQIQNNHLAEQHQMIVSVFDTWKGDLEQVDDVCVMGVRF